MNLVNSANHVNTLCIKHRPSTQLELATFFEEIVDVEVEKTNKNSNRMLQDDLFHDNDVSAKINPTLSFSTM